MVFPVRRLESHGASAWKTVERRGLKGLRREGPGVDVSRRRDSRMDQGEAAHDGVFVVVGSGTSMLLMASSLARISTTRRRAVGFKAHDVLELLREAKMFARRTSPFVDLPRMRNAAWLEPRLCGEVSYAEIVGGRLRAPSWRRIVARFKEAVDADARAEWLTTAWSS